MQKLGTEPGVNMVMCCSEIDKIYVRKPYHESELI